jgi:hypothetical protein
MINMESLKILSALVCVKRRRASPWLEMIEEFKEKRNTWSMANWMDILFANDHLKE